MVNPRQQLGISLRQQQRLALLGRLRMAEWIEMPERDFARQIEELEKDALFKKLLFGAPGQPGVIRRQRWPGGTLSAGFYDINEAVLAGGERVQVEEKLAERASLLPKIRRMGPKSFERYFIHGEEGLTLEETARRTGLTLQEAQDVHDLILELGVQAEFSMPPRDAALAKSFSCVARISLEAGEPVFEFFSPHWARGMYHVRYEELERWKDGDLLSGDERRRLRHLLKRIEILNLRQSTLFRVLEAVTKLHADYLLSRREDRKRPMSLRLLARRLDLSPSTVSRALAGRSVRLPWGEEVPLIRLAPGRRGVLRQVMARWLEEPGQRSTDASLADRLRQEYGISVSRRTVNAVRNEVMKASR